MKQAENKEADWEKLNRLYDEVMKSIPQPPGQRVWMEHEDGSMVEVTLEKSSRAHGESS